jgi:hypothetical protein
MKKQIIRLIALLVFASATITGISGCTIEYREHHHHWHHDHDRDDDNHNQDYHDYR